MVNDFQKRKNTQCKEGSSMDPSNGFGSCINLEPKRGRETVLLRFWSTGKCPPSISQSFLLAPTHHRLEQFTTLHFTTSTGNFLGHVKYVPDPFKNQFSMWILPPSHQGPSQYMPYSTVHSIYFVVQLVPTLSVLQKVFKTNSKLEQV